jgi:hypothetical protein
LYNHNQPQQQSVVATEPPTTMTKREFTTMTTTTVWVQLYIGQEKSGDDPFGVYDFSGNVDQLKVAVKEKCSNTLSHCDAASLKVYTPGTKVPILEGTTSIDPGGEVPKGTNSKGPLIVVAPEKQQQHNMVSR